MSSTHPSGQTGKMVWERRRTIEDGFEYFVHSVTNQVSWNDPSKNMEENDASDEYVWVPHEIHLWQVAKVEKRDMGGNVHVLLDSGKSLCIPPNRVLQSTLTKGKKQKVPLWPVSKSNLRFLADDLVMLDHVNEAVIIRNLAKRYEQDEIYTWVGAGKRVLVSINPFKDLGNDSTKDIWLHRNKTPNHPTAPHIFSITNDAYDALMFSTKNQSILVSGESGAGKTVATKQCLSFLATVSGSKFRIEQKLLAAKPLLEAFGNAKTIRNNNSSRFGNWMQVFFDKKKSNLHGGRITTYLLERTRVVYQSPQERNFHIFYALCEDIECQERYEIGSIDQYRYFNSPSEEVSDIDNLDVIRDAMSELGFHDSVQEQVLRLTLSVLCLGNVSFTKKSRGSTVASVEELEKAADLLEVTSTELMTCLTTRTLRTIDGNITGELNVSSARVACDSLAMALYSRLFRFLVEHVNQLLVGDEDVTESKFIGILDIFGFEIFENNSLEQLCINFCNEKLQQLFNFSTFTEEEQLYRSEGIAFTKVNFINNQPVLNLIEGQEAQGILPLLDDACKLGTATEANFLSQVVKRHKKNILFQTDRKRRFQTAMSFEISHYAGIVKYDATGFIAKNLDTLSMDIVSVMSRSTNGLLSELFPVKESRPARHIRTQSSRVKTITRQFREQLQNLMQTLTATDTRYIRCIKPNDQQLPNMFESAQCVEQLRCSGVFEAVAIKKTGYPFRYSHKAFACRFSCINSEHKYMTTSKDDTRSRVAEILDVSNQDFSDVQVGKSMVLYRAKEHRMLILLRNLALERIIPKVQAIIRGFLSRNYAFRIRRAEKEINNAMRSGKCDKIEAVLEKSRVDSYVFDYCPRNADVARQMLRDLREWERLDTLLIKIDEADIMDTSEGYQRMQQIYSEVCDLLETHTIKARLSPRNYYGHRSYLFPNFTEDQLDLKKDLKEWMAASRIGELEAELLKQVSSQLDKFELETLIKEAHKLQHKSELVKEGADLLHKLETLDSLASKSVQTVSRKGLEKVVDLADELCQEGGDIVEARALLALDTQAFLEQEYLRAKQVGDERRRIHREIRLLMEYKYSSEPDDANVEARRERLAHVISASGRSHRDFSIENIKNLRSRDSYAKSAGLLGLLRKGVFKKGMLMYTSKDIPTSLLVCAEEMYLLENGHEMTSSERSNKKERVKRFKNKALANFRNILEYCGEVKCEDPDGAARKILRRGIKAFEAGDDDLLVEMYLQMMKQLNNPVGRSEMTKPILDITNRFVDTFDSHRNGSSAYANALALMAMMVSVIPLSTKSSEYDPDDGSITMEDRVIVWMLNNMLTTQTKKYISSIHNVKYGGIPKRIQKIKKLRENFSRVRGKFSIADESELDDGPEQENEHLYLQRNT